MVYNAKIDKHMSNICRCILPHGSKLVAGWYRAKVDINISSVVEFQRWWVLKSKIFGQITVPIAEILSGKNARAWVSMVLYLEKIKINKNIKTEKKSWEAFRSCLLNSTTNSANFYPNWAGLAVLFSR